jgi:hypothetical protein
MFLDHGMGDLANLDQYTVAPRFDHRNMFFHSAVRSVFFEQLHLFSAAGKTAAGSTSAVFQNFDHGAALGTTTDFRNIVHFFLLCF